MFITKSILINACLFDCQLELSNRDQNLTKPSGSKGSKLNFD